MATIDDRQRRNSAADMLGQMPAQGRTNSYGDAAAATLDSRVAQIPTGGLKAPAEDGSQNNPLNSNLGRNVINTLSAIPGAASVPSVAARGAGAAGRALGAIQTTLPAVKAAAPYAPAVGGGAALLNAANAGSSRSPAVETMSAPPAAAQLQESPSAAAPVQPGSGSSEAPAAAGPANVIRQGNSYSGQPNISGDITINGKPPGGTFNALPGGPVPTSPPNPSPFGPTSSGGVPLIEAAGIRHSGNDWAARQNLKNLETSASSIMNRPEWNSGAVANRRGQVSGTADPNGQVAAYQQALATDAALQQAQPSLVQAMLRENAGLQREGMQQAGADRRSLVQAALGQQRLAMEQETQGYANRAAGQTEQLRSVLLDSNATPQQRQSAQQALMTLSGHQPADPYLVVPGGQQVDQASGRAYNTPSMVFNRSTGQFVQQPGQQGTRQAPAVGTVEGGWRFRGGNPADQRNWERA